MASVAAGKEAGHDLHSVAQAGACVRHYHLALRADFERRVLHGHVDLVVERVDDKARELRLDAAQLAVERVHALELTTDVLAGGGRFGAALLARRLRLRHAVTEGAALRYTAPVHHAVYGHMLVVPLPDTGRKFELVRVHYSTSARAAGVQWMAAGQTSGRAHPFMFTQCQAILARTLLPCQDAPGLKATVSLHITVPAPLVAVCSGACSDADGEPETVTADGWMTYAYRSTQPISTYLIAIAVGDLRKARVGPRSSVWAEPCDLAACVKEFSPDTERYLAAAERICDLPYAWGQYDMVVLPRSFAYGGMENPNATFLNAAIVVGDGSLTNVVAHEIVHSWAGNLVTNHTWTDFWLNEGFTVYIERLVLREVAPAGTGDAVRAFEMLLGYNDLVRAVEDAPKTSPSFTTLQPDLAGMDPDDAFSKVPYERGSLFLFALERAVGGPAPMMRWLAAYFHDFQPGSVTTHEMRNHFERFFRAAGVDVARLAAVDWHAWVAAPGLPPLDPRPLLDDSLATAVRALVRRWTVDGDGDRDDGALAAAYRALGTKQRMLFFDLLLAVRPVLGAPLALRLNKVCELDACKNPEVLSRWYQLALATPLHYAALEPVLGDRVRAFAATQGRGLYVKPVFKALAASAPLAAERLFAQTHAFYQPLVRNGVERILAAALGRPTAVAAAPGPTASAAAAAPAAAAAAAAAPAAAAAV